MTPEMVLQILKEALVTSFQLASPFLLVSLIVGIAVALFQTLTNLQEMTLSFIPKIIAVGLTLMILFPWMVKIMTKFTHHMIVGGWQKVTDVASNFLQ